MEMVELTTKDGFVLQGPYWPASGDTAVIFVHGSTNFYDPNTQYAGATERFVRIAGSYLAEQGIAVVAVRNRGSGRPEFFDDCVYDIQAYVEFARERGYDHIFLAGHSLGGAKVVYYTANNLDNQLAGLILLSCCPAIHGLYAREELLATARAMKERGEGRLFFGDARGGILNWHQADSYLKNFERGFQGDTLDLLGDLRLPILTVAMDGEPEWFQKVTRAVADGATLSKDIQTHLYPGVDSHMYFDAEDEVAKYIGAWVGVTDVD